MRELAKYPNQTSDGIITKEQTNACFLPAVDDRWGNWRVGDGCTVDTDPLPRTIISLNPGIDSVRLRPKFNAEEWIKTNRLTRWLDDDDQPQAKGIVVTPVDMRKEPSEMSKLLEQGRKLYDKTAQMKVLNTTPWCQDTDPDCTEGESGEDCPGCGKKVPYSCHSCHKELLIVKQPASVTFCEDCWRKPEIYSLWSRYGEAGATTRPPVPPSAPKPVETEPAKPLTGLAAKIASRPKYNEGNAPHLIIEALAGTGKTTTLIEGLKHVFGLSDGKMTPSPQQRAVWDAMTLGEKPRSSLFAAFNVSIADELKKRIPYGVGCQARTLHSFGYNSVMKTFKIVRDPEDGARIAEIIAEVANTDLRIFRKSKAVVFKAVKQLSELCKSNLIGYKEENTDEMWWDKELNKLARHYQVELGNDRSEIFGMIPAVLERCKDVARDGYVDYSDMPWIPVILGLPVFKNSLMLVDEAQDMDRCKQALAMMGAHRLILCGDVNQAIYGFAGADSESLPRMYKQLNATERGCMKLPLTVTRRCGKAIVEEAKRFVPAFEAHPSNPPGKVGGAKYPIQERWEGRQRIKVEIPYEQTYLPLVQEGDMILCGAVAPLVNQVFRFLKRGRKAFIQGRNMGDSLLELTDKVEGKSMMDTIQNLADWLAQETAKENAQRLPSQSRLEALVDKHGCLRCFVEETKPIQEEGKEEKKWSIQLIKENINSIFTDDPKKVGIKLSSIHRAKGLEADRIFYIRGFRRPTDKMQPWEIVQEENLAYVATTRAIKELWYVD